MKRIIVLLLALSPITVLSQSETTQKLHKEHGDAFTLFFYKSTLQVLADNEEFGELIKDIDKMKLVRIAKSESNFTKQDFKNLKASYASESFEDLISMRQDGKNVNVYIQEKRGITTGVVILMDDKSSLTVLDIKGAVDINAVNELIKKVNAM